MLDKAISFQSDHSNSLAGRIRGELTLRGQTTVRSLAEATGIPAPYVSTVISRLIGRGDAVRLGRGLIAEARKGHSFSQPQRTQLATAARAIAKALSKANIPAALSGFDVIGAYANQLPPGWPHLVYVKPGSGEWAADILRSAGLRPILNPSTDQMEVIRDIAIEGVIVLRERAIEQRTANLIKPREDAWVDLAVERRHGYPITAEELRDILQAMANDGISWTRLVRQARRRSLPIQLDPHREPPLVSEDQSTSLLIP